MKLINKYKSPNFNIRKGKKIKYIIIHYTALKNYKEAINFLTDMKKKVSSHYLISQKGEIFNLVPEEKRAWHAGHSYWKGETDINSLSIGIEIDYSPDFKNNRFNKKILHSLSTLLKKLKKKYKIQNNCILGHSDIAPYRKIDPGPRFPWKKLIDQNLSFNSSKANKNIKIIFNKWLIKNKIDTINKKINFMLAGIGYDTSKSKISTKYLNILIKSYKFHYLPKLHKDKIDEKTLEFIENHFLNLLLTKTKK